ncbi:PREDICTED: poliovirus receptor homolog [Rhinopithecus bieti]|uniref:poliovirus receptor homolog n=1 Tax=Rhinopithecus bieti TaxID=61621 RepID=UPI00083C54DE|nr:PREDICTED: poliovirus receptor homolog [Rhinopithecus bieti]
MESRPTSPHWPPCVLSARPPDSICPGSPAQRYLHQLPHGVIDIDTHTFISTDSPRDSLTGKWYTDSLRYCLYWSPSTLSLGLSEEEEICTDSYPSPPKKPCPIGLPPEDVEIRSGMAEQQPRAGLSRTFSPRTCRSLESTAVCYEWLPVSEPLCPFPADPPEVSFSGYDNNWYLSQNEATLTCDARSNPEPTGYNWSTTMGPLPPFAVAQGAQLLIRPVGKPINTTFICNVTNALGARQAELTVQVKEGPPSEPSGMSSNVIIFLTLGIVILLTLLGIGLYFCRSRYSCKEYASASANGYISYSDVSREASFCQDPQTEGTR